MKLSSFMNQSSWDRHYHTISTKHLAPAATLSFALEQFDKEQITEVQKIAVDLGSGNGIDSLALLANGWRVTAIDKEQAAAEHLKQRVPPQVSVGLTVIHQPFETVSLPAAMLINATFSLPFCAPQHFPVLWKNIRQALQQGGRFAGHFFGPEDSWSAREDMTFHTPALLQELFTGLSVEQFEETKREGRTVSGAMKHWHIFHIVAQYK